MICFTPVIIYFGAVFLLCPCSLTQIVVPDVTEHPNWHLLDHENCGIGMADRIIGGKKAGLGQFPWMARLGYATGDDTTFKCGGALINQMYVATAAHCGIHVPGGYLLNSVVLGEFNDLTKIDCDQGVCAPPVQRFKPASVIVHKEYGNPEYRNDIALIRLDHPADFDGWVEPICLPHGIQLAQNYEGSRAEVAGWGILNMDSLTTSHILQYLSVPVVNRSKCSNSFKGFAEIGETQICAGGVEDKDSCGGDSGGPLMKVEAVNGYPRYYLLGIVSFGASKCGAAETPAVYTRVASHVVWILDNMYP